MIENSIIKRLILLVALQATGFTAVNAQDASEIIRKADDKWTGEISGQSHMSMTIIRPTWERTIEFKSWNKGKNMSMTLITYPPKEDGQVFLKRDKEMWNWMPSIERMIKLPPSMMADGWMGSDYTNDDILNESSIVTDYSHKLTGSEIIDGTSCWMIELTPHEEAAVVWGKIIKWISKDEYIQYKSEYYDQDDYLIKSEISSDIKKMDGRIIPTVIEIVPAEKNNQKTVITLKDVRFNQSIEDSFFSQQNMRRLR